MFKRKVLVAAAVVLLAVMAVPSWGAQFRRKINQQFLEMCREGDTQGVIKAIRAGVNVNARDYDGTTALMLAAGKGRTEIVNALIKAGADVNATESSYGFTALMLAAGTGHTEIVSALIEAGAEVNAKSKYDGTALMFAAMKGQTEIVNVLIEAGADDLTDTDGITALIHAAIGGNSETVNALIDAGSNVKQKDNKGKTALDYARKNPKLKGTSALKRLERLTK